MSGAGKAKSPNKRSMERARSKPQSEPAKRVGEGSTPEALRSGRGHAGSGILNLLRSDHRMLHELFGKLEALSEATLRERNEALQDLQRELDAHAQIEREIFYPALQESSNAANILVERALKDHRDIEQLLEELAELRPEETEFDDKVEELKEIVEAHVENEETKIFAQAEKVFDEADLQRLGEDAESLKEELTGHADLGEDDDENESEEETQLGL